MFARARIALDAADEPRPTLDLATKEIIDVTGEGASWEAAKAAVQVPDGALLLAWVRDE